MKTLKTNKYDQLVLYRMNEKNKEALVNYRYRNSYFIYGRGWISRLDQ